jgi:hypothetical protein
VQGGEKLQKKNTSIHKVGNSAKTPSKSGNYFITYY